MTISRSRFKCRTEHEATGKTSQRTQGFLQKIPLQYKKYLTN